MYSYVDRIGAVELFIRLGKRVRATIRQLGYPTKNALKGWHCRATNRMRVRVASSADVPERPACCLT
jgi:hypothetical protein